MIAHGKMALILTLNTCYRPFYIVSWYPGSAVAVLPGYQI